MLRTILNVDDVEPQLYARSAWLRRAGFTVLEARNGADALALVNERHPALVLLDVNLPDIDGFEVCRRIKSNPATASTLVIHLSSSFADPGARVKGLRNGADGYLIEPVDAEEVVASVNALLRVARAEAGRRQVEEELARRAEELRTVMDLAPVALWVAHDPLCHSITGNQTANRFYEAAEGENVSASPAPGEPVPPRRFLKDGRELPGHELPLQQAVAQGIDVRDCELEVGLPSGGRLTIWGGASPLRDADGRVRGGVAAFVNVTERKQMEEQLREQAKRLSEANRLKDEFLATFSHELRTPLNAILGWSHILAHTPLDVAAASHAMDAISRNARAQAQLVSDVLDASRIVTGKLRLNTTEVDLPSLVRNAVEAVQPAADAKGIGISTSVADDLGAVIGDPDRLQQVLWNLLSNAVKFTPVGGRINVQVRQSHSQIEIRVSDTGMGIAREFLPHVFERFQQADSSTTRLHGGLGLGLAIARHLVELHGGTIDADSEGEGRGSTFRITLPAPIVREPAAEPARRQTQDAPAAVPGHKSAEAGALEGLTVLAVDDEPDARDLVQTILELRGATVIAVSSAAEALRELLARSVDLLLADIGMPAEDGYDLIGRVRRLPDPRAARVPAIALTAYGREEDRSRALEAGYQRHIAKPITPDDLVDAIVDMTKRSAASQT